MQIREAKLGLSQATKSRVLQRACACGQHTAAGVECEECRKKKGQLQRRSNEVGSAAAAPPIVHEVLRSPGQPLDTSLLRFMAGRFPGDFSRIPVHSQASLTVSSPADIYEQEADRAADRAMQNDISAYVPMRDFSHVRLHVDPQAAESARQVGALAYTVGTHIVFGDGQYAVSSARGKRLLAHELSHVIQQGGGAQTCGPIQTQVLQRDDDGSDDDDSSGEKKPKSRFDPPDQLGNCSVDIFHPEKFVNCCTEAIGDGKICTRQIHNYIDALRKKPCPEPAKRPDGTCCPLPMIWDGLKGKCSKTFSPLGEPKKGPMRPPLISKCLPGEKPNIFGGCCKPGDLVDQQGHACPQESYPSVPPDAPVRDKPIGARKTAPPAQKFVVHFQLDKPAAKATATESNLVHSLTSAGKSEWASVLSQLKANPSWKFELVGKASPEGPDTYNLGLGQRRALMVAKALMEKGIDRSRIVEVAPECAEVEAGIYTCGEAGASGPEDRQVKFVFAEAAATP
jgi:Domain of unknown function (DUF4157)/OmpA family